MKPTRHPGLSLLGGIAIAVTALSFTPAARANVYATNIKLNGNLSSVTNASGSPVTISYILNEPATRGTSIKILSNATVVATISIPSGSTGTLLGVNSVVWGGTNSGGANAPAGTYSVSITPSATGYTNWTQISSDANPGNYVYWPAGLAVNCNTNSLYYGRVMVANSGPNSSGANIGDTNGVIKLNADGSFADEGQGTGGYPFAYDGFLGDAPRRGRIAADDRFYFNDWSGNGKIVAVDMLMTSNQTILDSANFSGAAASGNWSEIDIMDVGTTNAKAYFADAIYTGQGLWVWAITNGGAASPSDPGTQVLAQGGTDIPVRSVFGLMLDEKNDIFIGDVRANPGDPAQRATCITNWPSSPNQPLFLDNVLWAVGGGDDTFRDISDLAIDSRTNPKYVACAMNGASGGMRILNAADGSLVTNLQQNSTVFFISSAWDNVGNVYGGVGSHVWRAFSPPGTNQATTVAVETIHINAPPTPPTITSISVSGGTVTIHFTAGPTDPSSAFTLVSSGTANPASSYTNAAGALITGSGGTYQATVPVNGSIRFYRIKR